MSRDLTDTDYVGIGVFTADVRWKEKMICSLDGSNQQVKPYQQTFYQST